MNINSSNNESPQQNLWFEWSILCVELAFASIDKTEVFIEHVHEKFEVQLQKLYPKTLVWVLPRSIWMSEARLNTEVFTASFSINLGNFAYFSQWFQFKRQLLLFWGTMQKSLLWNCPQGCASVFCWMDCVWRVQVG